MGRTGQAAAAKTGRLHAEIAAIFLHQHVSGHLRRAEQAVHRLVDGHGLVDPMLVIGMIRINLPAGLQFAQRQRIWQIAIDLVCGRENERRLRRVAAGHLQENMGAIGIDGEVGKGILGGPVVGGLRRGMDHQADVGSVFSIQSFHCVDVADIGVHVTVAL